MNPDELISYAEELNGGRLPTEAELQRDREALELGWEVARLKKAKVNAQVANGELVHIDDVKADIRKQVITIHDLRLLVVAEILIGEPVIDADEADELVASELGKLASELPAAIESHSMEDVYDELLCQRPAVVHVARDWDSLTLQMFGNAGHDFTPFAITIAHRVGEGLDEVPFWRFALDRSAARIAATLLAERGWIEWDRSDGETPVRFTGKLVRLFLKMSAVDQSPNAEAAKPKKRKRRYRTVGQVELLLSSLLKLERLKTAGKTIDELAIELDCSKNTLKKCPAYATLETAKEESKRNRTD